jgi:putative FmdB family regulatory protein
VPTYEYECGGCHRVFEVRQRISEPALTTCDVCGGAVRRLLSPTPFILKGGGWYVTDYPSESRKKAMESEKSTGGSAASEKSEKSDKTDKADKTDKPAKVDKPAAAAKSDGKSDGGSGGATSSGASSTASTKSD